MTAQAMETIIIGGKEYSMASEPLADYLANLKIKPALFAPSTACWRGYYGTWEIKNKMLYLIDLECYTANKEERKYWKVGMDFIFPNQTEVFAHWFSGEIRIPQGDILNYVHGGYLSKYEVDIFLEFQNGHLIGKRGVNNIIEEAKRIINEGGKSAIKAEPESISKSLFAKLKRIFKKKGNIK